MAEKTTTVKKRWMFWFGLGVVALVVLGLRFQASESKKPRAVVVLPQPKPSPPFRPKPTFKPLTLRSFSPSVSSPAPPENVEGIAPMPPPTPFPTPTLPPEPAHATLLIRVMEPDGTLVSSAIVRSEDCALRRRAPEGTIELYLEQPGCTFQGGRPDGLLIAWSEPFFIELEPGDDLEVDLVVPGEKMAGLGIQFQPDPEGFRVTRVIPGTPADEAGIARGDILLSVAGVSALDLDTESFIALATGPVGSQVDLVVLEVDDEGERERTVRITRRALEDSGQPAFESP